MRDVWLRQDERLIRLFDKKWPIVATSIAIATTILEVKVIQRQQQQLITLAIIMQTILAGGVPVQVV